jgi:exodeoxyribonuclease V alpha subunit
MSAGENGETLEGTLERFVFRSPSSTWVVARLARADKPGDLVTIVGNLAGLEIGIGVRLHGKWQTDKKYGEQFRVETYQTLTPSTLLGIEKYLSSGFLPGVGPETAKRIVAKFGLDTLDVLAQAPERLREVGGIGPAKIEKIRAKWQEQRELQDVMVFLQGHGVSPAFAWRIYKRYGAQTIPLVRENPYRLALDVWGIGFRSADQLAQRLGIGRESPARAEAGLLHVLGEMVEEGHVHAPEHELLAQAEKALEIAPEILGPAIDRLTEARRFVREDLGDRGVCLSLTALWEAETRIAGSLVRLLEHPAPAPAGDVGPVIAAFEKEQDLALATQQRAAVQAAVTGTVTVITGGPGVGKTTIVKAILAVLAKDLRRVALAAPTGRAAKRMTEATGRPATTIHRLLEFSPKAAAFVRGEGAPLQIDALVVDEASMLDEPLAAQLFAAVPNGARLILVGDVDQLPSVGPGRVLNDIIRSHQVTTVRLTEIFRQAAESRIVTNAHRINHGERPDTERREGSDFHFIEREEPAEVLETVLDLVATRIPRGFQLDSFADVQVLAPMHRGEVGAANLNKALQARLNPPGPPELASGTRLFRVGDKVIQLKNDYDKDVFNGDLGRIVEIVREEEPHVVVELDGRRVHYEPGELDQLGHAYALSVHKSQGSEYPAVVVPLTTQHYLMLRRNLLYTAMTRGKRLVVLVGSKKALGIAVRTDDTTQRWTWLAERIRAARSAP